MVATRRGSIEFAAGASQGGRLTDEEYCDRRDRCTAEELEKCVPRLCGWQWDIWLQTDVVGALRRCYLCNMLSLAVIVLERGDAALRAAESAPCLN